MTGNGALSIVNDLDNDLPTNINFTVDLADLSVDYKENLSIRIACEHLETTARLLFKTKLPTVRSTNPDHSLHLLRSTAPIGTAH